MSSALDELVDGLKSATEVDRLSFGKEPSLLLSIDVGTSGVRAALFDTQANELCGVKIARRAKSSSDFSELNPNDIVSEVVQSIDQLLSESVGIAGQVDWIAISTFWHSLLGVDATGKATTPVLTWADTRATSMAKTLRSQFNEGEFHLRTGCRFHSSYWPAKLLWLKQENAEAFSNTTHWLGFAEYLCQRLFGNLSASVSMASATGLFNQRTCDWDWDFVRALGISQDTLPPISRAKRSQLEEEFLRRWPSLADARLVSVLGDGAANNIGGGCSSRDKWALMVGTSGAMRVVFEGDPPAALPPALWSYRVDRRRMVIGGALSDGGGLYQWLTDSLVVEKEQTEFHKQLSAIEPDSHGLTLLPFWSGERSTGWSGDARGAILGLTQQTKPVEIVRVALESIAYRFALITRALESVTSNASIVATGNALRSSPVWPQIIADVLGKPVMLGGSPEASIRGAALLALEAVGKIGSIEEVAISVDEVFEPDMRRHVRYQQAIERQEEFYRKLV